MAKLTVVECTVRGVRACATMLDLFPMGTPRRVHVRCDQDDHCATLRQPCRQVTSVLITWQNLVSQWLPAGHLGPVVTESPLTGKGTDLEHEHVAQHNAVLAYLSCRQPQPQLPPAAPQMPQVGGPMQ